MLKHSQARPIAAMLAAVMLASCATGPRDKDGHPRTALDRSIGQCIATMAISTIAGALLGAAINRRNGAATGAAIGAGAGAVQCAIIIALNNEQDRQRIRDAEQAAYNSGRSTTTQFVGQDGTPRSIHTSVAAAPMPAQLLTPAGAGGGTSDDNSAIVGPCRSAQTQIVAAQGTVNLEPEIVCRTTQGDWITYNGKPNT